MGSATFLRPPLFAKTVPIFNTCKGGRYNLVIWLRVSLLMNLAASKFEGESGFSILLKKIPNFVDFFVCKKNNMGDRACLPESEKRMCC